MNERIPELHLTLHWRPRGDAIEVYATVPDDTPKRPIVDLILCRHYSTCEPLAECEKRMRTDAQRIAEDVHLTVIRDEGESVPPKLGTSSEIDGLGTGGELNEDGLEIGFGGACPVQGCGTLDGRACYYRARGSGWSFDVWAEGAAFNRGGLGSDLPDGNPEWSYDEQPYVHPEGGWLHPDESIANLRKAVGLWRMRTETP